MAIFWGALESSQKWLAEGIPSPANREGLPYEGHLLDTVSFRTPNPNDAQSKVNFNTDKFSKSPLLAMQRKLEALACELPVHEEAVLGVDVGIASCGLALVEGQRIVFLGVRLFDSPIDAYSGTSRNGKRRQFRLMRRRHRRQRQRRGAVRRLLSAAGIWPSRRFRDRADPYHLRAAGLDRRLSPEELGLALAHIVQRRGFVPRAKLDETAQPAAGPVTAQARRNRLRAAGYRTVGEMLANDPAFRDGKRNRPGDYRASVYRQSLQAEVKALFEAQRSFANPQATVSFQREFEQIAFLQADRGDQMAAVGFCPYLPEERRGARYAPGIERYRFVDALSKLRLSDGVTIRRLTPAELIRAADRFGKTTKVTRLDLRRWLALPAAVEFIDRRPAEEDIVHYRGAAFGTVTLRSVLGRGAWRRYEQDPARLDAIAAVLSFRRSEQALRAGLASLDLPQRDIDHLVEAFLDGEFDGFRGADTLSATAARRITPHLLVGLLVFDAAQKAGFDPLAPQQNILQNVRNPAVVRPVIEAMKQVNALLREVGYRPGRIRVETTQSLSLTPRVQALVADARRKRLEAGKAARSVLEAMLGPGGVSHSLVERYMLWQEQDGFCVYTGRRIALEELLDGNAVQVDHILPISRASDFSRGNTVVCTARANQEKGDRTPYEWRGGDPAWWDEFQRRLRWMPLSNQKRRALLMRNFSEHEGAILNRNLNDTAYGARCVLAAMRSLYPPAERFRRVAARPGQLTAIIRRGWALVKDRGNVRHHALDALVTAVASNRTIAGVAAARGGRAAVVDTPIPLPWPGFRDDALAALDGLNVSWAERQRGRGAAHGRSVRRLRISPSGERLIYQRRPITKLKRSDLDRIPDPDANWQLIEALRAWMDAGSPASDPPLSPQGEPVRRVRLLLNGANGIPRDGVRVHGGVAAYGDLVRVDVFGLGGRYAFVPVYSIDLSGGQPPPGRIAGRGRLREDWEQLRPAHRFRFSLYRNSFVRVTKRGGGQVEGIFRGFNVMTMQFFIAEAIAPSSMQRVGIGSARLIEKFTVDRLGRRFPVLAENRTWRGQVIEQVR